MLGASEPPIINPTSINSSGFSNLEHVFIILALVYLGVGLIGLFAWAKILSKAGYSGWWVLIVLVPFIGGLIAFVMFFVFAFSEWPIERQLAMARSRQGQPMVSHAPGTLWTAPIATPPAQAPGGYAPSGYAPSGYAPSGYAPSGYAPSGYAHGGYVPSGSMPGGSRSGSYPPPAGGSQTPPPYGGPRTESTDTAWPATGDTAPTSDPPAVDGPTADAPTSDPQASETPTADAPPAVRRSRYLPTNRTPPPPPPPSPNYPPPPPPPSTEDGSI